jgi:hydrogenase nickel incorporation protein HypA/HybF
MHELSIAQSVVTIASRHAAGRHVRRVEVEVGHLRQVVPSALEFAFELLVSGTELEGAELAIESVPAAGRCRDCGSETTLNAFPLVCGACGGLDLQITAGEELSVAALELDDELPPADPRGPDHHFHGEQREDPCQQTAA